MAKSPIKAAIFQDFEGGWSTDLKAGIKNSQPYTQAIDFRKSPSQMSVLPGFAREDKGICKDLIVNEVMVDNGIIYGYGNAGYLYKRTTAGVWSIEGNTSTGYFGMDYRKDADSIYLAGSKSVSLFTPVTGTGTPTLLPDHYNISQSTYDNSTNAGFNVNSNQSGGQKTYTPLTAINEATENRRFFQSDIEPLMKLSVFVVSKGSGDWTITVHDGLNNVLATATVTNANLVNNAWNDFVFSNATNGQVRIYIAPNARTYHFHVTSTVADGSLSTTASNDLSSSDMQLWADRLVVTKNGLHPIQRFQQFECIGNGNYLSAWEPIADPPTNSEWNRSRLVFPQEYEVCGLATTNEFLVIAAEKNTTQSTSTPQEGVIFFWDGLSDTYNYFVIVPEGSPQALHTYKNVAYYYTAGAWWAISSPATDPVKLRTMPGTDTEFSGSTAPVTVYPYTATTRRNIQLMAWPSITTNTGINFGAYSWGAVDKNYPDSFGYSYLMSTGSQNYSVSNNLEIGMLQSFGDLLHMSWRDDLNGGYGVDVITNASAPASSATWNSLIIDNGYTGKFKLGVYMDATFPNLPSGVTIKLKYQLDRSGTWVSSQAYSTANLWQGRNGYARFDITASANGNPLGRFYEMQLGLDISCDATVTTPPVITMVSLVYSDLSDEALM